MAVPLLDLTRQYKIIGEELEAATLAVLRSGRYVLGPEVEEFEREVAEYIGAAHVIGLSSGTDALLAALMALGIGPGDRVVMPVYSFFATAGTVARLGAQPVLVDIEPTWGNLDANALQRVIERDDNVRAAIFVHLYGAGSGIEQVAEVLDAAGIPMIEDAAQAIGTRVNGVSAGTIGRCGCFSTFPTKNLGGAGDGGFLSTNDDDLALTIRQLRNHGQTDAYRHQSIGGNFRLDALQAAVLRVKLRYLEGWTESRRAHADRYRELFAERLPDRGIELPTDVADRHTYHQFVLHLDAAARDGVRLALGEREIGCSVYYPLPFHLQPCFADLGYSAGDFPVAEKKSHTNLALPIFPELRDEELEEVVDAIQQALEQ